MISEKAKCALVIIDVQARLMPVVQNPAETTRVVADVAAFAGVMNMPVIVTEQRKLGDTLPEVRQFLGGFSPVAKTSFSCFGCPEFVDRLEAAGADTLILAGVEAHICVAQTALDAAGRFDVHVISDAVSSRSLHNVRTALDRLRQEGVTISSKEMFFYEVLKTAEAPQFKQALQLVK